MKSKYLSRVLCIVGLAVFLGSCATIQGVGTKVIGASGPKRKVALVGIVDNTTFTMNDYAHFVENKLLERLEKASSLLMISPSALSKAGAQVPVTRNLKDIEEFFPKARVLGFNALLVGDISEFEVIHNLYGVYGFRKEKPTLRMVLRTRLIDVDTHTVLYEGYRRAQQKLNLPEETTTQEYLDKKHKPPESLMVSEVQSMAGDIISAMANQPWKGFIADINANHVEINAGKDIGLNVGSRLAVWSKGRELTNYEGMKFRLEGKRIGTVQCERVDQAKTIAVAVDGQQFEVGDTLTLAK